MQMKLKMVRSLLVLSLAIILVIGGTTMAWFTAQFELPSAAEMVVGTLAFEITDASVYSNEGEKLEGEAIAWQAGECKEFNWTFKNTGSKTSFFRARVESILTRFTQSESAWGEGPRFNEQGNWAMYFTHNTGSITEKRLLAGQDHDIGTVRVWEEEGKLHVCFATQDGWYMTETHLAVAETKEGLPANPGGNLPPGQFPHKNCHDLVQSFTYVIDLPGYSPVYLAAHAVVVRGTETAGDGQITWSLPAGSAWAEGQTPDGKPDGWFYYCRPVKSGEEITLVLNGCLSKEAEGGLCSAELQAEAVQASHGAADAKWPDRPCS